jgi:hypothetical protein
MARSRSRKRGGAQNGGAQKQGQRQQSKKNGSRRGQKITARTYWGGHAGELPEPPVVRPSADPSAIVRSLGTPPLPGQTHMADQYFTAVYDRAIALATALATAGDLLEER